MGNARNAHVRACVDPVNERRKPLLKRFERLCAAACKAFFLPDLVEPPGIATVPPSQVHAPHAQPAGDPDFDRVRFGEWNARAGLRRCYRKNNRHM